MPNSESFSVLRAFILIFIIAGVCVYLAYRVLHLNDASLEVGSEEDLKYFQDGVLLNKEQAEEKGVKSQPPKDRKQYSQETDNNLKKNEVKRDAPASTMMSQLQDDQLVTNVMSEYNLEYTSVATEVTTEMPESVTTNESVNKEEESITTASERITTHNNLEPPKATTYAATPAPSSPPSKKPDSQLYTTAQVQKIAQDYFNSVTIQSTAEPGQKKGFATTPGISRTPTTGGLDSTKPRSTTPRPGRPKYTSYKIPTTTTLPPLCFRQPYKINQVCSLNQSHIDVKGVNVTLEDIAKMLFIKGTLSGLKDNCPPGVWCIEEDFELLNIMEDYLPFCDLQDCLINMPDECLNEERKLVLSSLFLFCEAHRENVTDECMFAIRKMVHVTMTDVFRARVRRSEDVCRDMSEKNECNGTCQINAQNLYCMSSMCSNASHMFQQFDQWSWFFTLDDAETKCNLNTSDCSYFELEMLYEAWWLKLIKMNDFLGAVRELDIKVIVAVCCVLFASMAAVVLVVWVCVKKGKIVYYSRDRVHYKEISDDVAVTLHDNESEDEVVEYHDDDNMEYVDMKNDEDDDET